MRMRIALVRIVRLINFRHLPIFIYTHFVEAMIPGPRGREKGGESMIITVDLFDVIGIVCAVFFLAMVFIGMFWR